MLTIATTAETPIMMPSMVSAARILLRCNARKATRMMFKRSMIISRAALPPDVRKGFAFPSPILLIPWGFAPA
jgi:hypothetical protein